MLQRGNEKLCGVESPHSMLKQENTVICCRLRGVDSTLTRVRYAFPRWSVGTSVKPRAAIFILRCPDPDYSGDEGFLLIMDGVVEARSQIIEQTAGYFQVAADSAAQFNHRFGRSMEIGTAGYRQIILFRQMFILCRLLL